MRLLALAALLLAGCAQPAPFFPKPADPAPVVAAAVKTEPSPAPAPRVAAAGEVRVVGARADGATCADCWTWPEILATLASAALFIWALIRLYRRKAKGPDA